MKYYARRKGLFRGIGLYNSSGEKIVLPKGVSIKFIEAGGKVFFQLFKNDQKITPVVSSIETLGSVWTMEIYGVGFIDLNIESLKLSPVYNEKKGMFAVIENDKLAFVQDDGKWIDSGLVIDKYRLGTSVDNSYLLKSLVGVKNAMGKCAIFDTESNKVIAPFEFESEGYDIVASLNNDTMYPERDTIYVIQSETSAASKFLKKDGTKKFTLVSENGKVVEEFFGTGFLWQLNRAETDDKGEKHDYIYTAFSAKKDDGKPYTKLLKINAKTDEVVFNTNIKGIAEKSLQELSDLLFLEGGELVLTTSETDGNTQKIGASIIYADGSANVINENKLSSFKIARDPFGRSFNFMQDESVVFITSTGEDDDKKYGAIKLTKNKTVEVLFDNEWKNLTIKRDATQGIYIEYYGTNKFGKYSLDGKSQSFESETSTFVLLAGKHFGKVPKVQESELSPEKRALRAKLLSKVGMVIKTDTDQPSENIGSENDADQKGPPPPQ